MNALVLFAAEQQETAQELRDRVSPGLGGFLAIFFVALATIFLLRSMTTHLRNVRYSPDPAAQDETAAGEAEGAGTAARAATPKAPARTESGEPGA